MKKNDVRQLFQMKKDELKTKLDQAHTELAKTEAEHAMGRVKNVHLVRAMRRDIARMNTAMKKVEA